MKKGIKMCTCCGRVRRWGQWGHISTNRARKVKRYGVTPILCPSCTEITEKVNNLKKNLGVQYIHN